METLKNIKSLGIAIVLVLSLAFVLVACEKKSEYVPTPAAPMTPAAEMPTPVAPVE
jgi:hypothetical protein